MALTPMGVVSCLLALLALVVAQSSAMDASQQQAAIAEGWHMEDLITFDDCPRRARDGDHLLL